KNSGRKGRENRAHLLAIFIAQHPDDEGRSPRGIFFCKSFHQRLHSRNIVGAVEYPTSLFSQENLKTSRPFNLREPVGNSLVWYRPSFAQAENGCQCQSSVAPLVLASQ